MNRNTINRILIVGNGNMGSKHLSVSKKLFPDAKKKILLNKKIKDIFTSSEDFLESLDEVKIFNPQIAIIANPASFHIKIAKELATSGIQLLIEKPLSNNSAGVIELMETCEINKVICMIGYNLRFDNSLLYFRQLIKKKLLGKIMSVRCEVGQYLPSWRPNKDYRDTVSAKQGLGGGVLLELSHEIDYLRWIFGEFDWVIAKLSKQSSLEIDVEDTTHLIIGFEPDVTGYQIVGNLNLDFIRHDRARSCTVICEHGTLKWDGLSGTVKIYRNNSKNWQTLFKHAMNSEENLVTEWKSFIEAIDKSEPPSITLLDGLRVLEIVEAAKKSTFTGNLEKINKFQFTSREL